MKDVSQVSPVLMYLLVRRMGKGAFEAEGRQDQSLVWELHCKVL